MAECTGSLASQDLSQVQTVSCVQNQLKPIVPIRTLSCSIKTLDVYVLRDKFFVRFTFLFFVNVNWHVRLAKLDWKHSKNTFEQRKINVRQINTTKSHIRDKTISRNTWRQNAYGKPRINIVGPQEEELWKMCKEKRKKFNHCVKNGKIQCVLLK